MTTVLSVSVLIEFKHERQEVERQLLEKQEALQQAQGKIQHGLDFTQVEPSDIARNFSRQPPPRHPPLRPRSLLPLIPMLVGTFASLLFAALLAWYFSKPIRHLREGFVAAADGKFDMRLSDAMGGRRDELADLGRGFDVMTSRLSTLIKGQTRLLHQVSHELRSPLARMQLAIGLAKQQPDKMQASLARIELESQRMDKLVGELLELSRLESGVVNIHKELIDVKELLASVMDDAQFEADAKNIKINITEVHSKHATHTNDVDFTLIAQPELLHRAIENVVRNALKYSPIGGVVDIAIGLETSQNTNQLKLSIADYGCGVPPAELESIFQPFMRASNANSSINGADGKGTDGHGVGLAIAKQVIEAHGGTIVASNNSSGGLLVTILLPI